MTRALGTPQRGQTIPEVERFAIGFLLTIPFRLPTAPERYMNCSARSRYRALPGGAAERPQNHRLAMGLRARAEALAPSLLRRRARRRGGMHLVLMRRLRAEQMPHEIVPTPPHHVRLVAEAVSP